MSSATKAKTQPCACDIFILAGGLSTRMGRDKSLVQLGRRTLLQHVRAAARSLGVPVRVIRRDSVPRCGPLGGIYTGLKRSRSDCVLFLACDMPFISPAFLRRMIERFLRRKKSAAKSYAALFAGANKRAGFPCLFHRQTALPVVERHIAKAELSMQSLAKALRAQTIRPPHSAAQQLFNLNNSADLKKAATLLKARVVEKP